MNRSTTPVLPITKLRRLSADVENICSFELERYRIGETEVIICIDKQGTPRYLIQEPVVDDSCKLIYSKIMDSLYTSLLDLSSEEDLEKAVNIVVVDLGIEEEFNSCRNALMYYVKRDSFGFGLLDVVLRDYNVEDIELCDWRKPVTVVHRVYLAFEALTTNIVFESDEDARNYVERLSLRGGRSISLAKPEIHAVLSENLRLAATLGSTVSRGPTFNIRRLPEIPIDVATLIKRKVIPAHVAALTWLINDAKLFYAIVGGSGSGKTTLLNALLQLSNPSWKIVVVQDVMEIKLPSRPRFVQFFGESSEDILQRCFTALRYRPDILVVGEVRGKEITALVRAVASGSGSSTTFHASTPEEYEMAIRNLLPRDLYTMLSLNTALLIFIARVRFGKNLERKVWRVYERVADEWREIYGVEIDNVYKSYTVKRLSRRLLLDDLEAELEHRAKLLESAEQGYESVENLMKKFYKAY
ncbi:MAG: type II/IV secretion system ATPase subunit [Ignisphaera sp.]